MRGRRWESNGSIKSPHKSEDTQHNSGIVISAFFECNSETTDQMFMEPWRCYTMVAAWKWHFTQREPDVKTGGAERQFCPLLSSPFLLPDAWCLPALISSAEFYSCWVSGKNTTKNTTTLICWWLFSSPEISRRTQICKASPDVWLKLEYNTIEVGGVYTRPHMVAKPTEQTQLIKGACVRRKLSSHIHFTSQPKDTTRHFESRKQKSAKPAPYVAPTLHVATLMKTHNSAYSAWLQPKHCTVRVILMPSFTVYASLSRNQGVLCKPNNITFYTRRSTAGEVSLFLLSNIVVVK